MIIRKTADGNYWLDEQKVAPEDVAAYVTMPELDGDWSADTVSGQTFYFIRVGNEVNQVEMPAAVKGVLLNIEANAAAIIEHRNIRLTPPPPDPQPRTPATCEAEGIAALNALGWTIERRERIRLRYTKGQLTPGQVAAWEANEDTVLQMDNDSLVDPENFSVTNYTITDYATFLQLS